MSAGDTDTVAKTEAGELTLKMHTPGDTKTTVTVRAIRCRFTTPNVPVLCSVIQLHIIYQDSLVSL